MALNGGTGRAPVVAALEDTWSATIELARSFTDADWDRPTRLPGWTVRDVVSHLIGTEATLAGRPQPDVEVPDAPHLRNDIARFNEAWVVERRDRPGAEILAEFEAMADERRAALGRMSAEQFDEEAWTPAGLATYGRFMQIRAFDSWMHEQDLRATVDRPGHLTGPAVDASFDEIALGLGYAVGKRAGAPSGTTVALVVTGPERRRLDVVVTDRARVTSEPQLSPTTTVSFDLTTFVELVGGRTDPGVALDDGRVALAGDTDLGERVARHLAFVI